MKICPKCGSKKFELARFTQSSSISVDFDENGNMKFIENEDNKTSSKEAIECCSCRQSYDLSNPDIVNAFKNQLIPCKKCGNKVNEIELNKDGVCIMCIVKEKDPSFGAILDNFQDSKMARAFASLKMENLDLSSENQKLRTRLEEAEKLEEKINSGEETKKRRGRPKKNVEESIEEEIKESETESIENDIMDSVDLDAEETDSESDDITIEEQSDFEGSMNPPEE